MVAFFTACIPTPSMITSVQKIDAGAPSQRSTSGAGFDRRGKIATPEDVAVPDVAQTKVLDMSCLSLSRSVNTFSPAYSYIGIHDLYPALRVGADGVPERDVTAPVTTCHAVSRPVTKCPKTAAERQRKCRELKKKRERDSAKNRDNALGPIPVPSQNPNQGVLTLSEFAAEARRLGWRHISRLLPEIHAAEITATEMVLVDLEMNESRTIGEGGKNYGIALKVLRDQRARVARGKAEQAEAIRVEMAKIAKPEPRNHPKDRDKPKKKPKPAPREPRHMPELPGLESDVAGLTEDERVLVEAAKAAFWGRNAIEGGREEAPALAPRAASGG